MLNNYIPVKFMDPMGSEYNDGNTIGWSLSIDNLMNKHSFKFNEMKQLDYDKITKCMEFDSFIKIHYPLMYELERDLSLFMHEQCMFNDNNIYIIDTHFAMLIAHGEYGYFLIAPREHNESIDVSLWLK